MDAAWIRAVGRRDTAIIGASLEPPPPHLRPRLVRAVCGRSTRPLGPVLEIQHQIQALSGAQEPLLDAAADRVRRGIRRRLLGDVQSASPASLVEALNLLARDTDRPAVIVLDDADRADLASAELLERVIRHPSWLQPALILTFAGEPTNDVGRRLLTALEEIEGAEAVIRPGPSALGPAPTVGAERFDPLALGPGPRRALRAAAVIGDPFDVELLGRLLGEETRDALELLQQAVDGGAPLTDLGGGRLRMGAEASGALLCGLLPSLRERWTRALADLVPPAAELDGGALVTRASDGAPVEAELLPPSWPLPGEEDRAADWLAAAGEGDRAAEQYRVAAGRAASLGAWAQAADGLRRSLATVEAMPDTPPRRRTRVELLLELSALFQSAGAPGATLDEALEAAEEAASTLADLDDLKLEARTLERRAAIHYAIGDEASLGFALEHLTAAIRLLQGAGDATGAARLLNDQAAVYVRLGDPVQAAHLLRTSREIFTGREGALATQELAETEHLLARLPLHAPIRPGLEGEAIEAALEHARRAEAGYGALEDVREQGRVWGTMGALLTRLDRLEEAMEHLERAAETLHAAGDTLGLARVAAGLSDALAGAARADEALELLHRSLDLNLAKGSRQGLIYNREALEGLVERYDLGPAGDIIARDLAHAEEALGLRPVAPG